MKGLDMHPGNDTNRFYDAIAEYYPLFFRDWETQLDREGLGLRSIFRNRGVQHVLDASCGAGAQAVPLAQLGFDVVAVDPSPGMLKKAQEIAEQYGMADKIRFERGDFLSLPSIVSPGFDAIITKGNALPHLLLDSEIEQALQIFFELLRPGGTLVIGMRDFGPFMEDRPRFIPGFIHQLEDDREFITFDTWEWEEGPPVIAVQNLFIVKGSGEDYQTIRRRVTYRPLSTDEVKVVLLERGFEEITDQPDRSERVLVARKPMNIKSEPKWLRRWREK
jgi:SAM-dependent methyltransferase